MAREVMAIRIDRGLRSRLRAAARRRRLSPSAAARVAVEEWLEAEEATGEVRPYEALADLVGSVRRATSGRGRARPALRAGAAARRRR